MHYTIERIDKVTCEIKSSSRRAGNDPGLAQALNLGRRLNKQHPEDTILITAIHGKDKEEQVIAVANPYELLEAQIDPQVVRLDQKKLTTLQKQFQKALEERMTGNGETELEAKGRLLEELAQVEIGA